jgi:ribosomal protein S24E
MAKMYKSDPANVVLFGFKTHFGGGKSTGFALVYEDQTALKEVEPKYRLVRVSVPFFGLFFLTNHFPLGRLPNLILFLGWTC